MLLILLFALFPFFSATTSTTFIHCISSYSQQISPPNRLVYSANDSSYSKILHSSIQNLRFNSTFNSPTPVFIITPENLVHVQAAVICSKKQGLELRVRSGGHDYEGLSYRSKAPFVLIDLVNLRKVRVYPSKGIARVQSGATIGELYYGIANESRIHCFPAGTCPTMGIGGHFSGGGKGALTRKYGLSADNVIDVVMIKANGQIVNRKSMGEDLFWAIRGGGGGSFGIVIEWTIKLLPVPPKVTLFNIAKTLEEGATELLYRWQQVAPRLDDDFFLRVIILVSENPEEEKTILVSFNGFFLGSTEELLPVISEEFPELDVKHEHCRELSWIESVVAFDDGYPKGETIEVLLDRNHYHKGSFKGKSDFVTKPISIESLEAMWRVMMQGQAGLMLWDPYGGRMNQILESQIPFPHRAGNLYSIQYYTKWSPGTAEDDKKYLEWIDRIYNFMTPFVSKKPRASYVNYRDLDLGVNGNGGCEKANSWGEKYFKGNFPRLVKIKAKHDPKNVFRSEQSIPLL